MGGEIGLEDVNSATPNFEVLRILSHSEKKLKWILRMGDRKELAT